METDKMIDTAVGAVIGALTRAAAEPALAAGGRIWAWLKQEISGDDANAAAAIEADAARPSAPTKVKALLQNLLHAQPALAQELDRMLAEAGGRDAITQSANVHGNRNIVAQTAGTNNRVRIGGR